jgi:hypothetical protein
VSSDHRAIRKTRTLPLMTLIGTAVWSAGKKIKGEARTHRVRYGRSRDREILRFAQDFGRRLPLRSRLLRLKINNPPVSLPRRLRAEPVGYFFSCCQVLQLLTLEASVWKRLLANDPSVNEHLSG